MERYDSIESGHYSAVESGYTESRMYKLMLKRPYEEKVNGWPEYSKN